MQNQLSPGRPCKSCAAHGQGISHHSCVEPLQHLPSPSISLQEPARGLGPGHQPEWATVQTIRNCQGCSVPRAAFGAWSYLPSGCKNMEPTVWLTKWSKVPEQLEENPECFSEQTVSTALLIIMTHQTRCLNIRWKWERASTPSYIIFSSYSPLVHPHLCTVAMYLVQMKPLATLSHTKNYRHSVRVTLSDGNSNHRHPLVLKCWFRGRKSLAVTLFWRCQLCTMNTLYISLRETTVLSHYKIFFFQIWN